MTQRHRSRRLALQGLCCIDVQGRRAIDAVDAFIDDSREESETVVVAKQMLGSTLAGCDECDALLARHARHWDMSRLALVDRNILRLAAWELRKGETPVRVVISEALRLAQEFSTAESPRFVNGVLDAAARELRMDMGDGKSEPQAAPAPPNASDEP